MNVDPGIVEEELDNVTMTLLGSNHVHCEVTEYGSEKFDAVATVMHWG